MCGGCFANGVATKKCGPCSTTSDQSPGVLTFFPDKPIFLCSLVVIPAIGYSITYT